MFLERVEVEDVMLTLNKDVAFFARLAHDLHLRAREAKGVVLVAVLNMLITWSLLVMVVALL